MTSEESWTEQLRRTELYTRKIDKLFQAAIKEAIRIGLSLKVDQKKAFSFEANLGFKTRSERLFRQLAQKMVANIKTGSAKAYEYSNANNDNLVDEVIGSLDLPREVVAKYKPLHLQALATFEKRRLAEMNLSERVWNLTKQFKSELEMALDIGIGEGQSANALSQSVRAYLNEPERLFRMVRDKRGVLQLSKAAKNYKPGKGVYRSSYKNAMRLSRTEINMSYRTADHERWLELDFVVGIKISRSNNIYTCDVCDSLKGRYPKEFLFRGWHPHCRCHATPVMASESEREALFSAQMEADGPVSFRSAYHVDKMNKGWNDWIKDNRKRILTAKTKPYFIEDNFKDGDITKGLRFH